MEDRRAYLSLLYDCYAGALTDRCRDALDLYYNDDLSLAEVAEHLGITRQGVRDVIVRAEATLTELEDKTGLIKRFYAMQPKIQSIAEAADHLIELNRSYDDPELERLAQQIKADAQSLKEE